MKLDDLLESKIFKVIILSIATFIVFIFVFGLGVCVGEKRAEFAFRWAEEYHNNFAGPKQGFFGDMAGRQFMDANGLFGQIIKINGQALTVKGANDTEGNILITEKTTIITQKQKIELADLKIGDNVVVIGEPDGKGQIEANLIRVMPLP